MFKVLKDEWKQIPAETYRDSEKNLLPVGEGMTQATLDSYNKDPQLLIPLTLNLVNGTKESLEVAAEIKSFYFGNKTISFDTLPQLINVSKRISLENS
ncbi:hypothetical protein PR048_004719 [Dryococelus australis]|uniref:Uncharacterized protein n=1 Tax=Dryococelus australis TaxID=614101 RepID=A0ABQ9I679_9NEOP|nr:hypothetical protein PR048_004719 [Dryococelus australis]